MRMNLSEKLDKYPMNVVGHFIINALLCFEKKHPKTDPVPASCRDQDNNTIIDIELKINGREMPVEAVIESFYEQRDLEIRAAALDLLKQTGLDAIHTSLDKVRHTLDETESLLRKKLGFPEGY